MIYKEEDFRFQVPTIAPATPHAQIPWTQLFNAVRERSLMNTFGLSPDRAATQMAADHTRHQRAALYAAPFQDAMFAGALSPTKLDQ